MQIIFEFLTLNFGYLSEESWKIGSMRRTKYYQNKLSSIRSKKSTYIKQ